MPHSPLPRDGASFEAEQRRVHSDVGEYRPVTVPYIAVRQAIARLTIYDRLKAELSG